MTEFDPTKYTEEELIEMNDEIIRHLKYLRELKNKKKINTFKVGDKVKFTGKKGTYEGTILKINKVKVIVEVKEYDEEDCGWDIVKYNVPASMLTKIKKSAD